jgi:gluconolactonase
MHLFNRHIRLGFISALFLGWAINGLPACGQEADYPVPPEATRGADVPEGKIEGPFQLKSKIYPGTERDYWIYVPAQYKADKPARDLG